jgi:hypothetical protein
MTIAFAAGAAVLGIACAIGHSLISERKLLRPLYAEPRGGLLAARSMRDITRGIFHMPSMVWAVLGIAVLAARIEGGNQLLSIVAAIIFTASGLGNLTALRRPHIGGLMILGAAALTLADLMLSRLPF